MIYNLNFLAKNCNISLIDQTLIASSDDYYRENVDLERLNFDELFKKFRENKISFKRFWMRFGNFIEEPLSERIKNQVRKDELYREEWLQLLKYISNLLDENGVKYVVIKFLRYPWSLMDDLDLLIPDPMQQLKALEALQKENFDFFRSNELLAHPLKISVVRRGGDQLKISVDIYPEPSWNRVKVSEGTIIISRRVILNIDKIEAFFPSPEDDLYLVGTHAYKHLRFTLAEILHGLEIISQYENTLDWEYMLNLAQCYGELDALYTYLKVLNLYSETFRGYQSVPVDVLNKCELKNICKKIRSWFNKKRLTIFPIRVPVLIGSVYSSIYHCKTMLKHMRLSELLYDFLAHYHWPSKLL